MSLTRRVLITWLAAALAAVRIPGVLALEKLDLPEDGFDDDDDGPFIEYLEVGEREEMLGGPAIEPGWYLHPVCMMGCCETKGPFPSREAALEANRILWEKFARSSQSAKIEERDAEENLYF